MQLKRPLSEPVCLRAAGSAYVVPFTIAGALWLLYGIAATRNPAPWSDFVGLLLVTAALPVWLALHRLVLTAEAMSYRTIFGTTRVPLEDIEKARIRIGVFRYRDRFRPTVRLEFYRKSSRTPLVVNLKVFPKAGIARLLDHIELSDRDEEAGEPDPLWTSPPHL